MTGSFFLALYEADARGLDEHVSEGVVVCVEEPNLCPVAVVRIDQLWQRWRFAVDFVSGGAVAHGGEALALIEAVHQTGLWQSPVGAHSHRFIEDDHSYVVVGVNSGGGRGSLYKLESSRLVGWIERLVGGRARRATGAGRGAPPHVHAIPLHGRSGTVTHRASSASPLSCKRRIGTEPSRTSGSQPLDEPVERSPVEDMRTSPLSLFVMSFLETGHLR